MEKTKTKNRYGLLGRDISYSFSQKYFTEKFEALNLTDHRYDNFDLRSIEELPAIIQHTPLKGLNVTIPYKEEVLPFLAEIDEKAEKIGAVNTIKFTEKGLKGFNTDAYGFQKSIEPFLQKHHTKALILGTGGASKAICFVLDQLNIENKFVSRNAKQNMFSYSQLDEQIMEDYTIIINCTPLGTFPEVNSKPEIPYQFINKKHLLFDLVYNPVKTSFLTSGENNGASICNGLKMLELQADKAWEIWNS